MDETGVKTSASRPPRVISIKGKKQVGVVATAEKGQLTTVICACNATGRFISPCFIFGQRKRMNERLLDGAPNGSQAWCSDSGWITNNTFNNWLQIFVEKTRSTEDRPVLLILDNHTTHQNLEALNLEREKHVIMVSIPPHTSHKLQPLDVSVYRSFKVAFEQTLDTFQKNHPGRRITQFDIAKLVCTAYEKSATVQNATSGFRKAGIFPYNRNLFTDLDFAPATVYENAPVVEDNENATVTDKGYKNTHIDVTKDSSAVNNNIPMTENYENATVIFDGGDVNVDFEIQITEELATGRENTTTVGKDDIKAMVEKEKNEDTDIIKDKQNEEDSHNFDDTQNRISDEKMLNTSSAVMSLEQPSTSYMISPSKILPSPKVTPTLKKRNMRCQKSEILTSSPFKTIIEKKNEIKKKPKLVFHQASKGKENKQSKKETYENKGKGKGKRKVKGKITEKDIKILRNLEQPSQDDVFCLFCGEQYIEPLTEDYPVLCEWFNVLYSVHCVVVGHMSYVPTQKLAVSYVSIVKCRVILYIPSCPYTLSILPS